VDISLDGVNWTNVDHQEKISYMNAKVNFAFSISKRDKCRYIRLANGKNRVNPDSFMISGLEFFGELCEPVAEK
jgi:hypothetical protein